MQFITFRVSEPLGRAIKKAAHVNEVSKQKLLTLAILEYLRSVPSDEVDSLVEEHKEEEKLKREKDI